MRLKGEKAVLVTQEYRLKIPVITLILLFMGCAYSFRGSLPENIRSVQVDQFRSSVTEYGLEQDITGLVTEAIVRDGRLAIDNDDPDARIQGTVAYFGKTADSYTGSEEVEQYRMEMRVSVSMDRTSDNEYIIRDETISEWILYDPVAETYDSAKERLVQELSEQVVRRCLSGW